MVTVERPTLANIADSFSCLTTSDLCGRHVGTGAEQQHLSVMKLFSCVKSKILQGSWPTRERQKTQRVLKSRELPPETAFSRFGHTGELQSISRFCYIIVHGPSNGLL